MNQNVMQLSMYLEQSRSLVKILTNMAKDEFFPVKDNYSLESNILRLKSAMEQNTQFILENLIDKKETDQLIVIAEANYIGDLLLDEEFIRLLAKNSLTNRIIKACVSKNMSEMLVYRIRECITAYSVYPWIEV